jgi:methylenetetrahydrofolate reductase (NADPH)
VVAGYPEGHPETKGSEEELFHLKEKVDAGGDAIMTSMFYDLDIFLAYVKRVREAGITCPILPGIMPVHSYALFKRLTTVSKVKVPEVWMNAIEAVKVCPCVLF